MTSQDIDELEATLDPTARLVISVLRDDNAQLRKQLDASTEQSRILAEQVARLTEQLQDLKQRQENMALGGCSRRQVLTRLQNGKGA